MCDTLEEPSAATAKAKWTPARESFASRGQPDMRFWKFLVSAYLKA
jgi:hypothetical protein